MSIQEFKKPRGRVPKNKTWNSLTGKWDDIEFEKNNNINNTKKNEPTKKNEKTMNEECTNAKNMNLIIVTKLETLRQKEFANNDKIRAMAYLKAIKIIKDNFISQDKVIKCGKELTEFKGIGNKIALKVDEIIETGVLQVAEEARHNDKLIAINILSNVYGIGPKIANKLVNEMGIMSIEELKKRKDELQTNKLPLMNKKQQIGLKYYDELLERIPRNEMLEHEKIFKSVVKQVNKIVPKTTMIVAGSFIRNASTSGDIDILIKNDNNDNNGYHEFISNLKKKNYIIEELGYKDHKFLGISKLNNNSIPRRIDITFATHDEFPFTLLYFTGNGSFNTIFRDYASSLGYILNEHNLRNISDKKKITHEFKTEKDIFDFFEFPYLNPEDRTASNLNKIIANLDTNKLKIN